MLLLRSFAFSGDLKSRAEDLIWDDAIFYIYISSPFFLFRLYTINLDCYLFVKLALFSIDQDLESWKNSLLLVIWS